MQEGASGNREKKLSCKWYERSGGTLRGWRRFWNLIPGGASVRERKKTGIPTLLAVRFGKLLTRTCSGFERHVTLTMLPHCETQSQKRSNQHNQKGQQEKYKE
jgi:hypothetical protein